MTQLLILSAIHKFPLQILELLTEVIAECGGGVVQQAAVKALIDAAESASGKAGCAKAGPDEVRHLLSALQQDCDPVRDAGLRGLLAMPDALTDLAWSLQADLVRRVWVARCDPLAENRTLADQLWQELGLETYPDLATEMLNDVAHPVDKVRTAAAEALAKLLEASPDETGAVLTQLLELFEEKLVPTPPIVDGLGRIIEPAIDHWAPRSGIALALGKIAPHFNDFMVTQAVSFFVPKGLGDRNEAVRRDMLRDGNL